MNILTRNHFENAWQSLKSSRGRTSLTVIGTTIGIASVTFILSMSHGINQSLSAQSITPTDSTILVRSGVSDSTLKSIIQSEESTHINTLTEKDASDIAKIPGVIVAPLAVTKVGMSTADKGLPADKVTLIGSSGGLKEIASLSMLDGQFIDEANGVVMGSQLSIDLFGVENSLGNVLHIRGETFTVVGVLKPANAPINYLGVNIDDSAIISLSEMGQFTSGVAQIQQIALLANSPEQLKETITATEKILAENHQNDHDFHILSGNQITKPTGNLLMIISVAILAVAGVSMLAGGIGIMNIMLVNVAERRREVGIRKAVGATRMAIINQFLIESAIIGLIGGVIGYLIGMIMAYTTSIFILPLEPDVDWRSPLVAIGLSIVIGIIFGIYPAISAARKNPIEALRL